MTHPQCSADSAIADALERCDWANVSIGNKAVIRAAVVALRAQPQPSADSALLQKLADMIERGQCGDVWDINDVSEADHARLPALLRRLA